MLLRNDFDSVPDVTHKNVNVENKGNQRQQHDQFCTGSKDVLTICFR